MPINTLELIPGQFIPLAMLLLLFLGRALKSKRDANDNSSSNTPESRAVLYLVDFYRSIRKLQSPHVCCGTSQGLCIAGINGILCLPNTHWHCSVCDHSQQGEVTLASLPPSCSLSHIHTLFLHLLSTHEATVNYKKIMSLTWLRISFAVDPIAGSGVAWEYKRIGRKVTTAFPCMLRSQTKMSGVCLGGTKVPPHMQCEHKGFVTCK